jgi:hypothetical protein
LQAASNTQPAAMARSRPGARRPIAAVESLMRCFDRNEYGVKAGLDKAARGYASTIVKAHEFSRAGRIIKIR